MGGGVGSSGAAGSDEHLDSDFPHRLSLSDRPGSERRDGATAVSSARAAAVLDRDRERK